MTKTETETDSVHSTSCELSQLKPLLVCVDDDVTSLKAVERLLASDFEVMVFESAEALEKKLDENPVDLTADRLSVVLADHRLPGQSGLDLLKKISLRFPHAVRVMFSGQINLSEMALAINESRIHRFIYKPWDNDYLRIQMLEALILHREFKEKAELAVLSTTDALTGLKNRRYFEERIDGEVERAIRHSRSVSLLMLDIDRFKDVNDRYGHTQGDQVLKRLAKTLTTQLRSIDAVIRYGGEEFCVILPDTILSDAMKVAERIRLSVQDQTFFVDANSTFNITVSLGVATVPDQAIKTNELIEAADRALFQAKRQGRNQTSRGM